MFSFTYYFNIIVYILCILFVFSGVLVSLNIVSILILAFIFTILLSKIIYANNFFFYLFLIHHLSIQHINLHMQEQKQAIPICNPSLLPFRKTATTTLLMLITTYSSINTGAAVYCAYYTNQNHDT